VRVTADVDAAVPKAERQFGRIGTLLNNAGHGLFGGAKEVTEAELQNILETNVFGAMRVIRAVLPVMRAQGSGGPYHQHELGRGPGEAGSGGGRHHRGRTPGRPYRIPAEPLAASTV
jgi:NAD(P)-dependent dehydrogenase (short-subunit alcohol dehydrogenase family)